MLIVALHTPPPLSLRTLRPCILCLYFHLCCEHTCWGNKKASISMLDTCGAAGECGAPTLGAFLAVWVGASVATLWWLRTVFIRYHVRWHRHKLALFLNP